MVAPIKAVATDSHETVSKHGTGLKAGVIANYSWSDLLCFIYHYRLYIIYYILLLIGLLRYVVYCLFSPYYEIYHRYRAVAEALRVQIFWYMVNISEPAMNNYLNHPIPEMDWVRNVLNTILLPICPKYDRPEDHTDLKYVYDRWLKDQETFFRKKIKQHSQAASFWNNWQRPFLVLTVIWLIIRTSIVKDNIEKCFPCWLFSFCVIFLAMSGVIAGCFFVWSRFRCYESQANRYKRILPIYEQFCEYFAPISEHPEDFPDKNLQKELYTFGKYALGENADWFLTQRKLKFPGSSST